jgi:hypothetical protein
MEPHLGYDPERCEALNAKIRAQLAPGATIGRGPGPVVDLEDFFRGNDDRGSIGCNLSEHPGPQWFYLILRNIRARDDVQDVLVEIREFNVEGQWPFSDQVYILTTATPEQVADWLEHLNPDAIEEGYLSGEPPGAPELRPGFRVVGAWWD